MTQMNNSALSRRQWMGLMSMPAVASASTAGLLATALAGCSSPSQNNSATLTSAESYGADNANMAGARIFNIRDFGAIGDGETSDTAALQAAINACSKDQGGTVLVPAGVFVTGTVEMKSNITLHIVAGGKLLGSANAKEYHGAKTIPLKGDSTLGDGNYGLITGVNLQNVTIEGPGTIDGQGHLFHAPVRGARTPIGLGGDSRVHLLLFYRCENLTVRDINLFESGYHCVRVIESSYVHMDNIHIHNRVSSNNDGFHFISCEHVAVSNCHVQSQDDACAMFGRCRFFTITNSSFSTRWSVFRFGDDGAENIVVSNCLLYQVYGCPIKLRCDQGGRFENMSFSNLILQDVTGPINISVGPRKPGRRRRRDEQDGTQPSTEPNVNDTQPGVNGTQPAVDNTQPDDYRTGYAVDTTLPAASATQPSSSATQPTTHPSRPSGPGIVRNISFSNIFGTVTTNPGQLPDLPFTLGFNPGERFSCITINCVGDSVVENISFDDIHLTFGGGGDAVMAAERNLPQFAGEYFELGPMPAYGLYARNVRGLTMNNVRFEVSSPELRPAVIFDHVQDAAIYGLSAQGNEQAESLLRFTNSQSTLLTAPRILTPVPVFLRIEGNDNQKIIIDGGDLSNATQPLAFADGATPKAVKLRD
jgi:Glycosyl hydrolases family 28